MSYIFSVQIQLIEDGLSRAVVYEHLHHYVRVVDGHLLYLGDRDGRRYSMKEGTNSILGCGYLTLNSAPMV